MKKIISLAMVLLMLCFVGCQSQDDNSSLSSSLPIISEPETELYKIGLLQFADTPELNTIKENFMSRLQEWGYNENLVTIDYQNSKGDKKTAESISRQFVLDEVDMIVAVADGASKAALDAVKDSGIKIVYAVIGDVPIAGPNVTGTSAFEPSADVVNLAQKIDSKLDSIGVISSGADLASFKARCSELEVSLTEASPGDDAAAAANELFSEVDAVFTAGLDKEQIAAISDACIEAKVPLYSNSEYAVQAGALAAISTDNSDIGAASADAAVQIIEGREVSELTPAKITKLYTYMNQKTLSAFEGIVTVPDGILASAMYIE